MKYILLLPFLFLLACSSTGRQEQYSEGNKQEIEEAIKNLPKKEVLPTHIIGNQESAVTIAEAIVISVYGKDEIIKQRPYSIAKHNDYWIVSGSLHTNKGGVFTIILDAKTAEVIKLTHEK